MSAKRVNQHQEKRPDIIWQWIKYKLALKGMKLISVARLHGVRSSTLRQTKYRPCPKFERIIAAYLDCNPWDIWPSRYDENGKPNRPRHPRKSKSRNAKIPYLPEDAT